MTLGDKVFGVRYINRRGFERKEECPQVIVATGGVSYPATGSTGDGYTFAADLGHTVEPVRPSLTPLVSLHPQIGYLDGLLLKTSGPCSISTANPCARSSANWASLSAASRVPWRCA